MRYKNFAVILVLLFVFALAGCSGTPAPADPPGDDTPIDPQALIDNNCAQCHSIDIVYSNRDKDTWPAIVAQMTKRASRNFSDEEVSAITEYLQENYGN